MSRIRIERAGHVVDIEDSDRSAGRLAAVARRLWADTAAGDTEKPTVERGNAGQQLGFAPRAGRRRYGQFDQAPAAYRGGYAAERRDALDVPVVPDEPTWDPK